MVFDHLKKDQESFYFPRSHLKDIKQDLWLKVLILQFQGQIQKQKQQLFQKNNDSKNNETWKNEQTTLLVQGRIEI